MITLEQLDELEGRIVRALELIGDLRSENSRLESENERLRTEHDELKIALDEKEKTVQSLKEQLDKTGAELNELKQKESVLEKRITEMLSRLSDVGPSSSFAATSVQPKAALSPVVEKAEPVKSEAIPVEPVKVTPVSHSSEAFSDSDNDDESVVILDDQDLPLERATTSLAANTQELGTENTQKTSELNVKSETEHGFTKQASYEREKEEADNNEDDDIIILDDDEDDVVFVDEDAVEILETPQTSAVAEGVTSTDFSPPPANNDDIILDDDDDLGIFDMDDDEDFLIVEEDTRNQ